MSSPIPTIRFNLQQHRPAPAAQGIHLRPERLPIRPHRAAGNIGGCEAQRQAAEEHLGARLALPRSGSTPRQPATRSQTSAGPRQTSVKYALQDAGR